MGSDVTRAGPLVATLDRHGVVVASNRRWREAAAADGGAAGIAAPLGAGFAPGCADAAAPGADREALARLAEAAAATVAGERDEFAVEIALGSGAGRRAILARGGRVAGDRDETFVTIEDVSATPWAAASPASRRRYEQLVATLAEGVVYQEAGGEIRIANPRAAELLGLTPDQLMGRTSVDPRWETVREDGSPFPGDEHPAMVALRTGRPQRDVVMGVRRPTGVLTWILVNSEPVGGEPGAPVAVVTSFTEVTEHAKALTELRRSEALKAAIGDAAVDGILVVDHRRTVLDVSASASEIFGWPAGDAIGRDAGDVLLPERDRAAYRAAHDLAVRTGTSPILDRRLEITALRADGSEFPAEIAIGRADEDPPVFVAFVRDLTDRKAAEQAEQATMSRLANLVSNLNAGALVETEERRIALVNQDFCMIFGIPAAPEVLAGADCSEAAEQSKGLMADPEGFVARIGEILAARELVRDEEVRFADGRIFERDYIPIFVDEAYRGHLWLYRDVTARAAAAAQLEAARDEAVRASRLKSEFLATMSHEIRTPMNGVIATLDLLATTSCTPEQERLVSIASASANGLLAILDDVLDLSKIEAEKLEPRPVAFHVGEVVESAAEVVAPTAKDKRLRITTRVDPQLGAQLEGDARWLRQVLVNLAGNAVKFTDAGQIELRADLAAGDATTVVVRFAVQDSGVGIPAAAIHRLFEPFSQVDGTRTRRHGGTGLGLAIASRLVRLMGGSEIVVDSEPGRGSTFAFEVPLVRVGAPLAPGEDGIAGLRVLLVDPAGPDRDVAERHLAAWRTRQRAADTLDEAAAALAIPGRFDLVVLTSAGLGEATPAAARDRLAALPGGDRLPFVLVADEAAEAAPDTERFAATIARQPGRGRLRAALMSLSLGSPAGAPGPAPDDAPAGPDTLPPARVLVAEDTEVNRELILRQLAALGLEADAVATGRDAVEAVASGSYDVVLMDHQMPEMDGLEATRLIRAREAALPGAARLPIVAVTASSMEADRIASTEVGMDGFVAKPLTMAALRSVLAPILAGDRPAAVVGARPARGPGLPLLDRATLERIGEALEDPAEVRRIGSIFLDGLPAGVADVRAAIDAGDADALHAAAHKLKSTSAAFGALRLSSVCIELETLGRNSELDRAAGLLDALGAAAEASSEALAEALGVPAPDAG